MALGDPHLLERTLNADERAVLNAFVRLLKLHYAERLERAAVFGSRARGDVGAESDIDVLVVLCVEPAAEWAEERVVRELLTRAGEAAAGYAPIAPAVFSAERFSELHRRERRFALEAEREGIRL